MRIGTTEMVTQNDDILRLCFSFCSAPMWRFIPYVCKTWRYIYQDINWFKELLIIHRISVKDEVSNGHKADFRFLYFKHSLGVSPTGLTSSWEELLSACKYNKKAVLEYALPRLSLNRNTLVHLDKYGYGNRVAWNSVVMHYPYLIGLWRGVVAVKDLKDAAETTSLECPFFRVYAVSTNLKRIFAAKNREIRAYQHNCGRWTPILRWNSAKNHIYALHTDVNGTYLLVTSRTMHTKESMLQLFRIEPQGRSGRLKLHRAGNLVTIPEIVKNALVISPGEGIATILAVLDNHTIYRVHLSHGAMVEFSTSDEPKRRLFKTIHTQGFSDILYYAPTGKVFFWCTRDDALTEFCGYSPNEFNGFSRCTNFFLPTNKVCKLAVISEKVLIFMTVRGEFFLCSFGDSMDSILKLNTENLANPMQRTVSNSYIDYCPLTNKIMAFRCCVGPTGTYPELITLKLEKTERDLRCNCDMSVSYKVDTDTHELVAICPNDNFFPAKKKRRQVEHNEKPQRPCNFVIKPMLAAFVYSKSPSAVRAVHPCYR